MSTEKITEKLTKVVLGMIADATTGILSLDVLLHNTPELKTDDLEQLYLSCKAASEAASHLSMFFTRPVTITFNQGEMCENSEYVPDCKFVIAWTQP